MYDGPKPGPGRSVENRYAATVRAKWILEQVSNGRTLSDLSSDLGISDMAVSTAYRRALQSFPDKTVEQHRALMMYELAEAKTRVMEVLHADHPYVSEGRIVHNVDGHDDQNRPIYGEALQDSAPVLRAAQTLVAIQAREARLLGADAPQKTELSVERFDSTDLRVIQLVSQVDGLNTEHKKMIEARVRVKRGSGTLQTGLTGARDGAPSGLRDGLRGDDQEPALTIHSMGPEDQERPGRPETAASRRARGRGAAPVVGDVLAAWDPVAALARAGVPRAAPQPAPEGAARPVRRRRRRRAGA